MNPRIRAMDKLFQPETIAFVGASNNLGKWGGIVFHNLLRGGFPGRVFPVNPREAEVQGLPAYQSMSAIPEPVDLAIFTIPAKSVPEAIREAVKKRVPAGIVISAGFGELGGEGKALESEMVRTARAGGMILVGPNGQGISVPGSRLHPWMPTFKPRPGHIAIVSQSGNVSTVLAEQLAEFGFGCSAAISAGNCADLGFSDYLDYFRADPETRVIALYIEGVDSGPGFFRAARAASLAKPVVVIKGGRTQAGSRAASTHTGVLAGADEVFSAVCRQAGLVRAETLEQAAIMAATFVATPLPAGRRVAMITGGGGFGVLAADAAVRRGLELPPLSEPVIARLREKLPPWWSPNNPVDMVAGLGYGGPEDLVPILMESEEVDGVILLGIGWIYSMLDSVDSERNFKEPDERLQKRLDHDIKFCDQLLELTRRYDKPLLMTSSVARLAVRRGYPGLKKLLEHQVMIHPAVEDAIAAFSALAERGADMGGAPALPNP